MNPACKILRACGLTLLLLSIMILPRMAGAQEKAANSEEDALIAAAREIMDSARYCALITLDRSGRPQARAMEPFAPEADMVVWLGTNSRSRKVQEIRKDPRVTLYYADPEGGGYVAISGTAQLVDDPKEKAARWKEGWEEFYPDRKDNYLLIAITPLRLEIISYRHGITGDTVTWRTPSVEFEAAESRD